MPVPAYLWTFMTWVTFVISAPLPVAAAAALKSVGAGASEIRRVAVRMAVLLAAWIAVAAGMSTLDLDTATFPGGKAAIAFTVAAAFAVVFYIQNHRVLEAVPQSWLIGAQAYRGLGAIFLVVYGLGLLPATFALPAGFGDWAVGLLAIPVAAYYAFRKNRPASRLAAAWNVLGMADLVIAVSLGVLNTRGLHVLPPDQSNELLVALPLSLVPFYLVPLSFVLHIASLAKLARARRTEIARPAMA